MENGCARCLRAKARRADVVEYSRDYYLRPVPFDMVYTDVCVVKFNLSATPLDADMYPEVVWCSTPLRSRSVFIAALRYSVPLSE